MTCQAGMLSSLLNFGYCLLKNKGSKASMFQYKIIHNILCTKSSLFKMKKEDSLRCPFCPADHLFTEYAQATLFWKEFLDWASHMVNSK